MFFTLDLWAVLVLRFVSPTGNTTMSKFRRLQFAAAALAAGATSTALATGTANTTFTAALDDYKATFDAGTPIVVGVIAVIAVFGLIKLVIRKAK